MYTHTNLDRVDSQHNNTQYPFHWTSSLVVNGLTFPHAAFRCAVVQLDETKVPPVHISKIAYDGKVVVLTFSDYDVGTVGTLRMLEGSAFGFIRDAYSVIVGHCAWAPEAYSFFTNVLQLAGEDVQLEPSAFRLLPECHKAILAGRGKAISFNGYAAASSMLMETDGHAVIKNPAAGEICMHLYGDPPDVSATEGIQTVNTVLAGGRHMLLAHAPLSDIRVTVVSGQIQIRGVLDVD